MRKNRQIRFLGNRILKKVVNIMKLTFILLFVSFMQVSASLYSQDAKVSIQVKECLIEEVFQLIEQQTNYVFVYNHEQVSKVKKISAGFKDQTVAEVLDVCLKGSGLCYELVENTIIIRDVNMVKPSNDEVKEKVITGKVMDTGKKALPGVSVLVKGTTLGVVTDIEGKFRISLPGSQKDIFLLFSFIGMKSQLIKIGTQDTLNIVLEEELQELDEVVSLGYFNVDKRKSTSAITSLKMDDIMQPGVSSLDQMLEGRVPGMIFMQNSGQVGASSKLKIRGTTTLMGSTEPLWVLDGVILHDPVNVDPQDINDLDFVNLLGNAISGLNPNDIEQIDVLKDASATAIYGPKASNGVIVITTKKGYVGKPSISYGLTTTFRQRPRYTDRAVNVMNSEERIAYSREAIQAGWLIPMMGAWVGYEAAYADYLDNTLTYDEFKHKVDNMEMANTDWLGILLQDTWSHNHTMSISGGSENLRYYTSIGYMSELGNIKKEKNERYTAMAKLNINYDRLDLNFNLSGNLQKKEYTPKDVGVADYAYNTSRSVQLYNEKGELYFYDRNPGGVYVSDFNIVNEMKNSWNHINTDQINLSVGVGYKFVSWLKGDITFSYGTSHTDDDTWYGENSYEAIVKRAIFKKNREQNKLMAEIIRGGEIQLSSTKNENYSVRGALTFNKMLTEEQNISASLIGELSSSKYEGFDITRRNYLVDRGIHGSRAKIIQLIIIGWLQRMREVNSRIA